MDRRLANTAHPVGAAFAMTTRGRSENCGSTGVMVARSRKRVKPLAAIPTNDHPLEWGLSVRSGDCWGGRGERLRRAWPEVLIETVHSFPCPSGKPCNRVRLSAAIIDGTGRD